MKLINKVCILTVFSLGSLYASAQDPFGTDADQGFGNALWRVLEAQGLVGANAIMSMPYEGNQPHGNVLVALESEVTVNGQRGEVIVKRNYGGPNASIESVSNNPQDYLMATTVMFRRDGFDAENDNWFWAKWMADGSYDTAPNGNALVGKAPGCIACHTAAPGDDMVYLNDRY